MIPEKSRASTSKSPAPLRAQLVVEAHALSKLYGARHAVAGLSFEVRRGEAFGLLGPNGAGKSTTMRMIACRTPPTSGRLCVEGLAVDASPRRIRSLIGVVPQENNLDPDLSVRQNLLAYARYFRLPPSLAAARSDELLDFVGLASRPAARVGELSGGMKRRLMIARALLHEPRLLVLDEPTTGLDPHVRQELWQRLEELRRLKNLTVLLSTHYMEEAERLCDRLVIILRGRIIAAGTPRDLIVERVPVYVLEVRDPGPAPATVSFSADVRAVERSGARLYFADSPELLTPLMRHYDGRRALLRRSNLEDVFLDLIRDADLAEELRPTDI